MMVGSARVDRRRDIRVSVVSVPVDAVVGQAADLQGVSCISTGFVTDKKQAPRSPIVCGSQLILF